MFARFGSQARRVIELAEDHARALWRPAVGPQHLLLALLAVDDTGVFVRSGLRFDDVRSRLVEMSSDEPPPRAALAEARHLPLRLRSVFQDGFRQAVSLGAPEVKPLHLALALVTDPPGEIARVFRGLEVKATDVRDAVLAELLESDAEAHGDGVVALPRARPHHTARRGISALGP